jgi:predicted RNA-binding protein YlqC (UPF0109 family)
MVKEMVESIAKLIVDKPNEVKVNLLEGTQTNVIELRVAKEDLGKVIGKEGRNAKAIRTLLNAIGNKINKRIHLEIIE